MSHPAGDPEDVGGSSIVALADHLTGPLRAGAVLEEHPLSLDGRVQFTWAREPLLLLRIDVGLDLGELLATVVLTPLTSEVPGTPTTVELRFAAFTERGSCLALPSLQTGSGSGEVAVEVQVPGRTAADVVTPLLVQGVVGRLAHVLTAEKAAVRRAAREVAAARIPATARRASLDRHGADLGVARFTDRLVGNAVTRQVSTAARTEPDGREPDEDYRRRLQAVRRFRIPTPAGVRAALEVPLAELGLTSPVEVVERTDEFAVGVQFVAAGAGGRAALEGVLADLRRDRLVRPASSGDTDTAARLLSGPSRDDLVDLRATLLAGYGFTGQASPDPAFAPGLARCLALAFRLREALGDGTPWEVRRAQDPTGGNRYQLGAGADLVLPDAAAAETLRQIALTVDPGTVPVSVRGVLLAARAAAGEGEDPELRWLLEGCGLRTVQPLTGAVHVSHLPVFGLDVTVADTPDLPGWTHLLPLPHRGWRDPALLRYAAATGRLELVTVAADGTATVVEASDSTPGWTSLTVLPSADPARAWLVVGHDAVTGDLAVHGWDLGGSAEGATQELQIRTEGWEPGAEIVVAARFRGPAAPADLVVCNHRTGSLKLYRHEYLQGIWPGGPAGDGDLGGGGGGRWTHLLPSSFRPVRETGPDVRQLLCYDRRSGDLQLLEPVEDGFVVAWRIAGWRSGYTHLTTAADGATLVAHDRERGGLDRWTGIAAGNPVPAGTDPCPPRTVTAMASVAGQVLLYDRARGRVSCVTPRREGKGRPFPGRRRRTGTPPTPGGVAWHPATTAAATAVLRGGDDAFGPEASAVLAQGLDAAASAWSARGGAPWSVLVDRDAQRATWEAAADAGPAARELASAGLPPVLAGGGFATSAAALPAQYVVTVELDPATVTVLAAGDQTARDEAAALVEVLSADGLACAVALTTAAGTFLVVSVTGLPGVPPNLADRRTAGFRWYALPVRGLPGLVAAVGASSSWTAADDGVTALVVLAHRRGGDADPYEVLLRMPPGAVLTPEQYEFALNVVARAVPAGIEVNTYALRRRHLDLDGDLKPDPLSPDAARSYRRFR